jgi:hypothetical protein
MIFWLVLKLEINSYRVIIIYLEGFLVSCRRLIFFEDYIFCMVEIVEFSIILLLP